MPEKRNRYDEEFRALAVRIVAETRKSVAVARDLGSSDRNPSDRTTADSSSAPATPHPAKKLANSFFREDRRGDAAASVGDDVEDPGHPAPHERHADVRSLRLVHGRDDLRVTVRFFDLTLQEGKGESNPSYRVDVAFESSKKVSSLEVTLDFGLHFERSETTSLHPYDSRDVRCHIGRSINAGQNLARIRVPPTCLGNPDWEASTSIPWPTYLNHLESMCGTTPSPTLRKRARVSFPRLASAHPGRSARRPR